MPSTITTYYTFQPATKARSSQVNLNFSNYRGDLLPINENTASASNNTHYLGGSDHYWAGAYVGQIDFITSTTTSTLVLKGDTSSTLGAFLFQVEGSTRFSFSNENGIIDSSYPAAAITPRRLQIKLVSQTTTANVTIPADVTYGWILGVGGGGGGGGGSGSTASQGGGGGGGGGNYPLLSAVQFSASEVITCGKGVGGSGGAGGLASNAGASGAAGTASTCSGSFFELYFPGAAGGAGGSPGTGGAGGSAGTTVVAYVGCSGGGGANSGASTGGNAVQTVRVYTPAAGGTATSSANRGGAGGGGGSGFGKGGYGGNCSTSTAGSANQGVSPTTTSYGAGGGGGGGAPASTDVGAKGGNGADGAIIIAVVTAYPFSGTI